MRRPDRTLAVADHNVPTEGQALGVDAVADEEARLQLQTLERNVAEAGIEFFPMGDLRNGIVHVVGPEQGRTQPGMTIVCGDSHTSTHGAFGALAHGIGTSRGRARAGHPDPAPAEVEEHAGDASTGEPPPGVGAKDFALAMIGQIGTGRRHRPCDRIRRRGDPGAVDGRADDALQHDHRGRRARRPGGAGRDHLRLSDGPPAAPKGGAWEMALAYWKSFVTDPDARFDREVAHRRLQL